MWETVGPITNYAKPYILDLAAEYFSKVIDLELKIDSYKDEELYFNGQNTHYTSSGYRILANEIFKELK